MVLNQTLVDIKGALIRYILIEKLHFHQFYEYLNANTSFYKHHSSFKLLHSVTTAIMASTNDWYLKRGRAKYIGLPFVDLKKAFHTVDHEIPLEIENAGLNGLEHDWFTSYLENCKQFSGFAALLQI